MLMDSENQPPPIKRMRNEDYLGSASLILSPTSMDDFFFPAVDSVCTIVAEKDTTYMYILIILFAYTM